MDLSQASKEVQELFEQARKNTQPREHHIVPASYLRRWAVDEKVRVHILDENKTFLSSPAKAGRQTDYYRAASDQLDPEEIPPMIFETILSRVEGPAVGVIDRLLQSPAKISLESRNALSTFIGFQSLRGHQQRLRIGAIGRYTAKLMLGGLTDAQIAEQLQSSKATKVTVSDIERAKEFIEKLQADELTVQPQNVQIIALAFSMAELVSATIFIRPWILARTPPSLITTDEPVHPIAGPGALREESAGFGHAGIVAFPLSPEWVLLAVRPDLSDRLGLPHDLEQITVDQLDYPDTFALDRDMLMSATRWAFERPDRRAISHFSIPPRPDDLAVLLLEVVDRMGASWLRCGV